MIDFLLIGVALATLIRRSVPAAVFLVPTLLHYLAEPYLGGADYYATAALADFATVAVLGLLVLPDRLTLALQVAATVSIGLNGLGWWLWATYQTPGLYDAAFVLLWAVILSMIVGFRDVGGGFRPTAVFMADLRGPKFHRSNEGAA